LSIAHHVGREREGRFYVRLPVLAVVALLEIIVFYVYSYNSGYGFDALEYLVIGRSLLDGYSLYSFIPSKSWGLYVFVATAFRSGVPSTHVGVSALVTFLFAIMVICTWYVTFRLFGPGVAVLNTALVSLCAAFMELNFLEPEPLVYLCGLGAYNVLAESDTDAVELGSSKLCWAGLLGAIGCAFKAVAAFYVLGVLVYVVLLRNRRPFDIITAIRRAGLVGLGFACGFAPQFLYFYATGRGSQFLTWTFIFPLLHYPHSTQMLAKLYTKLLWFFVLTVICVALSIRKSIRQRVRAERNVQLAVVMAVTSLLTLFRNQAAHYVFPGAAFLCLFISWVIWTSATQHPSFKLKHAVAAFAALVALVASAVYLYSTVTALYSPHVLRRFVSWQAFAEERPLQMKLQSLVKSDQKFIAITGAAQMYWLSRRYPPLPVINTEVQTSWWLRNAPQAYADAVRNRSVVLVEFNPDNVSLDDPDSYVDGPWQLALDELHAALLNSFCTVGPPDDQGHLFWIPNQGRSGHCEQPR
jgi:hypothetical protein